jgi:hypothetical protein
MLKCWRIGISKGIIRLSVKGEGCRSTRNTVACVIHHISSSWRSTIAEKAHNALEKSRVIRSWARISAPSPNCSIEEIGLDCFSGFGRWGLRGAIDQCVAGREWRNCTCILDRLREYVLSIPMRTKKLAPRSR